MKKVILLLLFFLMAGEIGAADKTITCDNDGCWQDTTAPLFEGSGFYPGQTINKVLRIENQRNKYCALSIGKTKNSVEDWDQILRFINLDNLGTIPNNTSKEIQVGLAMEATAGNEWADKNIDYSFNFNFECETETIINPDQGVYINEFLPHPIVETDEWVEIYNDNNFDVQLNNWKIRDTTTTNIKTFTIYIAAKGYGVVNIGNKYFNNTGYDEVKLLNQDNVLIDEYSFSGTIENLSYSKQSDLSWCQTTISPGSTNYGCGAIGRTYGMMTNLIIKVKKGLGW